MSISNYLKEANYCITKEELQNNISLFITLANNV